MGLYIDNYRPWPGWVVKSNEEIAHRFNTQIGTYPHHAHSDPGKDTVPSGGYAADFWLYDNSAAHHDQVLAWFKINAKRLGATYIITRRRIWSVARAAEGVREYTGSDPHTGHIHISYGREAPGAVDTSTSVRSASFNIRHKTPLDVGPRAWSARLPQLVRVIRDVAPSVLGVQECNDARATELTHGLGPNWNFWGSGTAKIIWRADKWVAIDHQEFKLKSTALPGFPSTRPLTCVRLQSIATGADFWAVATHLAVNMPGEAKLREAQAVEIVAHLATLPEHERVVIFGDLNDAQKDQLFNAGVRKILGAAGYRHLRDRLTDNQMDGDSRNSRNGWGVTGREGIWIDDVLTSPAVTPYAGTLVITGTPEYEPHASDHNLVRASFKIDTPKPDTPSVT